MTRHLIFTLILILICSSSFAGNLPPWDKIPNNTKELLIRQYVNGFVSGMNRGVSEGIKSAIKYTEKLGNSTYIDSNTNIYNSCSNIINSNTDRIYDETVGWQQININNTNYYIKEINAFIKNNPKCTNFDVQDLIEIMTPIWLNLEKNVTYEDIAKNCSK